MNEMHEFLNSLPKPERKKRNPVAPVTSYRHDYNARYDAARRVMFERKYPQSFASGRYYSKKVVINTTNGFQNYIQDVLTNLGHKCENIKTTGTPRRNKITGEIKWTYSGSTKGSTDLHAVLKIPSQRFGVPWKIEVKSGKDNLRKAQEKYRDNLIEVGSLYTLIYVGDTDLFWDEYDKYIKL